MCVISDASFVLCIFVIFSLQCAVAKRNFATAPVPISPFTVFNAGVARKSCQLIPDVGPCRANIKMFYFDPADGECKIFRWGGCQGNGNRFNTKTECKDYCVTKNSTKIQRPRWCNLSFDYGFCFGAISRYYYDPIWKVCKERIYSGCGGNKNNFYSFEQCENICRFGKGKLKESRARGSSKKVIILNHPDATKRSQ